jgi:hypothetical protein
MPPRLLFIVKSRDTAATDYSYSGAESGLLNSARFVVEMLIQAGVEAYLVQVTDNNDIDREVHQYKPTHVIIEALWVVPEKFEILTKLYPTVKWIIRSHSEITFLANEGMAMDWIRRYVAYKNVYVATNSTLTLLDLRTILHMQYSAEVARQSCIFLPNYYPVAEPAQPSPHIDLPNHVHIGCFGAIRPMKNQLIQAIAAIRYADMYGKTLHFHLNNGRQEQGGNSALRNIRDLFNNTRHELIEHGWMKHAEFLKVVRQMDVVLQVSLTESFCIVAADAVANSVPLVTSDEVPWTNRFSQADATDANDIVRKIKAALNGHFRKVLTHANRWGLAKHCRESKNAWLDFLFVQR